MEAIAYRPDIDGLRAVAIIPVILFHLGVGWLRGGYLGVDVFFVISGFLITSILLREMAAGQFSFRRFWSRRVRRILPALLLVTAATLAVTWAMVFPPDRPDIGRQAVATLLSFANFYFWRHANNYWGPQAEDSPFLHAWSLAVEEQFYILFPLYLFALNRWAPRWFAWGVNGDRRAQFLPVFVWVTCSTIGYVLPPADASLGVSHRRTARGDVAWRATQQRFVARGRSGRGRGSVRDAGFVCARH